MKVKEFIELLSKENPESDIHFDVSDELFLTEYSWAHAETAKVKTETRYMNSDGTIKDLEQLEEYILDTYEIEYDDQLKDLVEERMQNSKKLEGVWIRIEP